MSTTSRHAFLRDVCLHWHIALARALCFMTFWIILLPSVAPSDLVCGLIATVVATTMSLGLLPPAAGELRLGALLVFAPHFLIQSLLAGIDVARRALDPRLPLKTGIVVYRVGFPRGMARNQFAVITSLLPGTLPVDETEDGLIYHCLDITQPIVDQLADEERRLQSALISGERHD